MKKGIKKILSAVILTLMLSEIPTFALEYTGLGEIYDIKRDTVGDGLKYTELYSTDENGKNQQAYIFEYTPGSSTLPIVRWGNYIYGQGKIHYLVSAANDNGTTVFGALNGDFFSMQTGVPMGVIIDSGKLISSDDSRYALGFYEDGSAVIGKPSVSITVTNISANGEPIKINHFNKYPSRWGAYMLTKDFEDTTKSTEPSREISIRMMDELSPNGTALGIVEEITESGKDTPINDGCAVISVSESFTDYALFADIAVGDTLQFDTSCSEGWENIVTAIGGGDVILENGIMPEDIIDEDHEKISHPRTAVGIRDDGSIVFFAVDGRTSASRGLKLSELAGVMTELGCVRALNLDGGGSTTVMVKASNSENCVYINTPADAGYRAVGNAILFVSENASDGTPAALSVIPNTPYVLGGSTVDFSALVLDLAYMPTGMILDGEQLTAEFAAEYTEDIGKISKNSFTAGNIPGEYKFTVSTDHFGETVSGDVSVIVVDSPESIRVTTERTKIRPGTYLPIEIEVKNGKKAILHDIGSFTYTLNGEQNIPNPESYPGAMLICDLGYLDVNGNFQSFGGDYEGTVEIGIQRGDFSETVTLEIGDFSDVIADFEASDEVNKLAVKADLLKTEAKLTEGGYKSDHSLEISYESGADTSEGKIRITPTSTIKIDTGALSVKLWVSGDIPDAPSAILIDGDGIKHTIEYTVTKDYTVPLGWRELTAVIPGELKSASLTLDSLLEFTLSGEAVSSFRLDGAIIYYGSVDKPAITGFEGHWAEEYILMLYDVYALEDSDCEVAEDGTLIYSPDKQLTRGEFAKILSLRLGIDVTPHIADGIMCEPDTPEDKLPYIRAVIEAGLMNGRSTLEDGTVIFDANATITREEACKVLGIILPESETAEITFSDADTISQWAVDGIASCISAGIIKGFTDGTVRPRSNISRAEFATMLSRLK